MTAFYQLTIIYRNKTEPIATLRPLLISVRLLWVFTYYNV
nr:MAG TPA: hypothetical protein [Caudoviricetes sp.]DAN80595.1 MAG TPA: hypothetical protein [Caudoviricetes sp.]DAQ03641.1 MAG TPA: hypothetical protein [Bacteriophage sp.]DAX79455.1 MAG TPA: hypothetical protein [Caudoviricetes sp.]